MINFKNKKILVTGATGGIGSELVKKFVSLEGQVMATGTNTEKLDKLKKNIHVVFCLERVVQGLAIDEIKTLPQVIAATNPSGKKRATELVKKITNKFVYCKPKEAEFSKLFSNAYRYIQFGIANDFYMMAESSGLNFHKIHKKTRNLRVF